MALNISTALFYLSLSVAVPLLIYTVFVLFFPWNERHDHREPVPPSLVLLCIFIMVVTCEFVGLWGILVLTKWMFGVEEDWEDLLYGVQKTMRLRNAVILTELDDY